ncbi:MAG: hypothetical protein WC498_01485 [Candidatus Saccharimonadales bacterium]
MTATNHALTGALIGLTIGNPAIAIPLAFASHFVLDAIPHYTDDALSEVDRIRSRKFKRLVALDAAGCLVIVLVLAISRPDHWLTACVAAFFATSPDLLWFSKFVRINSGRQPNRPSAFARFHHGIQWSTHRWGKWVEMAWTIAMTTGIICEINHIIV